MRSTSLIRLAGSALLVVSTAACGGGSAPAAAPGPMREIGAFVVRLGADTVAVEEFTRSGSELRGRQIVRSPRTQLRDFSAALNPDGTIRTFEVEMRDAPGAAATMRATMEFGADSAVVRVRRGEQEQTFRLAAGPGSLPALGYSMAVYEAAFAAMRAGGRDTLRAALVPAGGTQSFPLQIHTHGADSMRVVNLAGESRVRVDEAGRLLTWDGRGSTLDLFADRAVTVDIDLLAADFAARDAAGRGLGSLSPRDSVSARVGDATVTVAYGRPAARGREIFGVVVPWGEVWRTGANQATELRTDRDLVIGDTPVPAGSYTLFSIPRPDGWELIVNRRSGQWGTDHDPTQDLARIPMRREALAERVERFTIEVRPGSGGAAELRLAWDDVAGSVPIRAP